MVIRFLFFSGIFLANSCISAYCQERGDLARWLSRNSVKMDDSTYGIENYKQLDKYLFAKQIIGAGEATHGTADFQKIKYNLFKYLVINNGFRTLALEVPNDGVNLLNDYILHSKGNSADAVKALNYWTFHTRDTQELVEWIRAFNLSMSNSNKIKVYGIDISSSIDTRFLKDSLLRTSLFSESGIDSLAFVAITASQLGQIETGTWNKLDTLTENILAILRMNKKAIERYVSDHYIKSLELSLISLKQVTALNLIRRRDRSESYRDSCMAVNTAWLIDSQSNKKVFLGAHNGHIQNTAFESKRYATGYYLKKLLDTAYYSIGFQFSSGDFSAIKYNPSSKRFHGMATFNVDENAKRSFGNYFSQQGVGSFFLDFNSLVERQYVNEIFYKDVNLRMIGCCYDIRKDKQYFQRGIVSDLYDGLFFIQKTQGATLFK